MNNIRQLLEEASQMLAALADGSPRLEAELLLAHVLERPRTYLLTWPERVPESTQAAQFADLLRRRAGGEPLAYILGHREFWSLDLRVTPDVLIPRPDTELLVETALELGAQIGHTLDVADLGTGSGAIAAALAAERPHWRICATDISAAALAVAKDNFQNRGLNNIEALLGPWCQALPPRRQFDLLASNPPYIADLDPHLDRGDVRHEPRSALAAGADGLDDLRIIAQQATGHLKPGGWLLMEHGFEQGPDLRRILEQAGFGNVQTRRDLAGHERVSGGRQPG